MEAEMRTTIATLA